ncbi:MAG: type II toxin-antitoxin system HicB family antitoxin [Candidatus Omnitrophica bacterium]|nr:type II toxin-antitoxin system HicB family antitoxin [Candidatus Omnitrophota bacterium]
MVKYSVSITWSEEDEGFIAIVPELNGLSAFGKTYKEASEEIEVAIENFLKTLKDEKIPIPKPKKLEEYSGQTRLRMPKKLHRILTSDASNEGVSLNAYMVFLLTMHANVHRQIKDSLWLDKIFPDFTSESSESFQEEFGDSQATPVSDDQENYVDMMKPKEKVTW